MAVRIADTLKQQNNLTTFPVAYGEDIWLDENKGSGTADYDSLQNLYNDGKLGGSSIQVETMPAASASNVGKIVQYVGTTGSYKKGHFYECVHNKCDAVQPVYRWIDVSSYRYNHVVYNQTTEPINSDFIAGDIIYYTGVLTDKFKPNHYYRALPSIGTMEKYTFTMYRSTYGGMVFWSYTPFEFRQGFIVYPTGGGGELEPYEITSITDEKVTITPYGDWGGEPLEFDGVLYTSEVKDWEELEGGGGTSIFYGTMDEWNALSADEKKQYDYMSDDQNGTDGVYPSAPTTPEIVFDKLNQSSNIDATYTVTKKAFHIIRVHCYSEGPSHSASVYLNGVNISNESSYQTTSGVGYSVTIPCNVGDVIRMVVTCGGSGTYDKRSAAIYRLN